MLMVQIFHYMKELFGRGCLIKNLAMGERHQPICSAMSNKKRGIGGFYIGKSVELGSKKKSSRQPGI